MGLDWDNIEKEVGAVRYKGYAPNGEYEVKLDKVEVKDKDTWGCPKLAFSWQEDDQYKYPNSGLNHPLSLAKPAFRALHARGILMEFGVAKEAAQQAVETAERDQDRQKLAKAYQAIFDRIAQKHPVVKIIVRDQLRDGKPVKSAKGTTYSESEFANPALQIGGTPKKVESTSPLDALGGDEISGGEIPF